MIWEPGCVLKQFHMFHLALLNFYFCFRKISTSLQHMPWSFRGWSLSWSLQSCFVDCGPVQTQSWFLIVRIQLKCRESMTITFERLCLFSDFAMVQHFFRIGNFQWLEDWWKPKNCWKLDLWIISEILVVMFFVTGDNKAWHLAV